jgi:predicted hydrocarbon binding protein
VETYRLLHFTLQDILELHCGTEQADALFREAGSLAGRSFFNRYLSDVPDVPSLTRRIQDVFYELGMGIFRVETADSQGEHYIFTLAEDVSCSGLPDIADVTCGYDEGFIQGVLEAFSGKSFDVKEIDCWCTGSRTCRFEAKGKAS